jgi:general secretion pathway protein G
MSGNSEERRSDKGFSLIELIIVLVILGLLVGIVGPKAYNVLFEGKDKIAKIQISTFEGPLGLFAIDVGRFPSSAEGLEALVQNPGGMDSWKGPYLAKAIPKDPWGKPYVYSFPGAHGGEYDLFSMGADGIEGNDDDICSWK